LGDIRRNSGWDRNSAKISPKKQDNELPGFLFSGANGTENLPSFVSIL